MCAISNSKKVEQTEAESSEGDSVGAGGELELSPQKAAGAWAAFVPSQWPHRHLPRLPPLC